MFAKACVLKTWLQERGPWEGRTQRRKWGHWVLALPGDVWTLASGSYPSCPPAPGHCTAAVPTTGPKDLKPQTTAVKRSLFLLSSYDLGHPLQWHKADSHTLISTSFCTLTRSPAQLQDMYSKMHWDGQYEDHCFTAITLFWTSEKPFSVHRTKWPRWKSSTKDPHGNFQLCLSVVFIQCQGTM